MHCSFPSVVEPSNCSEMARARARASPIDPRHTAHRTLPHYPYAQKELGPECATPRHQTTTAYHIHTMSDSTTSQPTSSPSTSKAPQALSNREEEAMMKEIRLQAVKKCDPVVKKFADCAQGRTISVAWACREENKAMKECFALHMNNDAIERSRREYLVNHRS